MNCLRCNTPNEDGAKFCKNCGMDLTYNPALAKSNSIDSQSLIYVLIALSWEYIGWIIWFLIQKVIVPKFYTTDGIVQWEKANKIYNTVGWSVDILSILVFLVLSIVVKNKTARILLIVFAVLRVGFLLSYRVFTN